ncbi:MAG: cbb3-type cytochrome c oxidase subunit I [Promethearchaeota archaeon]
MVHVPSTHEPFYKNFRTFFGTTHHTDIGLLYLGFATINLVIAGLLAMVIRLELVAPGPTIVDAPTYTQVFTNHGVAMIFLVVFPIGTGFGNYLIPKLIGAKDMYWPRWNNAAFWMLVPGALFIYIGMTNIGWTGYAPLSLYGNISVDFWAIGLIIIGFSSLAANLNFIVTIIAMRKPEVTWSKLDLFSWSILLTAGIQVFATPVITSGLVMLLLDRVLGSTFFAATSSFGGPLLWQHVFWAYSHPAVYIMILPAMGLTSVLISKFSRNEIFGYSSMVLSMAAIGLLGFMVWGHHMYTVGIETRVNELFNAMTFIIAVPSGIKTFNWLLTMYGGKLKLEAPLLFSLGFIIGFLFGGITGIMVNLIPLDLVFHDTYFVVGHFHLIVGAGAISTLIGAVYYLFPTLTGKMYNRKLSVVHFLLWSIGALVAFAAMLFMGTFGFPRRYYDYSAWLTTESIAKVPLWLRLGPINFGFVDSYLEFPLSFWVPVLNIIATIGAFLMALGFIVFVINLAISVLRGQPADDDPFGLEEDEEYDNESTDSIELSEQKELALESG